MNSTNIYKPVSEDEFKETLADLSKLPISKPERQYIVLTGKEGARQINKTITSDVLRTLLKSIEERGLVTRAEYRSIEQMIDSNDWRDQELASIIIKTKGKIYESNI